MSHVPRIPDDVWRAIRYVDDAYKSREIWCSETASAVGIGAFWFAVRVFRREWDHAQHYCSALIALVDDENGIVPGSGDGVRARVPSRRLSPRLASAIDTIESAFESGSIRTGGPIADVVDMAFRLALCAILPDWRTAQDRCARLADLLDAASKAGAASSASGSTDGPGGGNYGASRSAEDVRREYEWVRVGVDLRLTLAGCFVSGPNERETFEHLRVEVLRWMDEQFNAGFLDPKDYIGNELAALRGPGAEYVRVLDVLEQAAQKRPVLRAALEKAEKAREQKVNKGPGGDGSPEAGAEEKDKQKKIVQQNIIGF